MWSIFPELAQHSDGATASSLAEARLVFEEFGRPAHTYAPVYTDRNIEEILDCSDHITFNSVAQFERFGQMALLRGISCGLRINPGYSPVETDLYNPCVPGSRLGIPAGELKELPAGVEGLHFHVLCESRPEHLRLALDAVENAAQDAGRQGNRHRSAGSGHNLPRLDSAGLLVHLDRGLFRGQSNDFAHQIFLTNVNHLVHLKSRIAQDGDDGSVDAVNLTCLSHSTYLLNQI